MCSAARGAVMTVKRHQAGMTLIEVLVGLVVVSIGLLGLAGLQIASQKQEIEAYQQEQAMMLADYIVERMKLNRRARECYGFTNETDGAPFVGQGGATPPPCTAFGTSATRALADSDITAWHLMLNGVIEQLDGANVGAAQGAAGCIWFNTAGDVATVTVAWQGEFETEGHSGNNCAQGMFGKASLRRVIERRVEFADLS